MIDITGLREDKRPQSSTIVHALLDRLEAAEADALEQARLNGMGASREAALMAKLEAAEKERDELRNEIACVKEVEFPRKAQAVADAWKGKCERLEAERDALRAKLEAAESDAAHQKALAASALRVAEGWERKCGELRAKIEAMEQQEPVAWLHESRRDSDVVTSAVKHVWQRARPMSLAAYSIPLYLAPGAKGE